MKTNKRRNIKIIFIVFLIILLMNILIDSSFASTVDPDSYKPDSATEAQNADRVGEIGNKIVGVVQVIGVIISVAVLAVIGIKYMVGSVEERAEYKQTMMPYFIGAIMLFGITNLVLPLIISLTDVVL